MKKYRFIPYGFYFFGSLILTLLMISSVPFMIIMTFYLTDFYDQTVPKLIMLILCVFAAISFPLILGKTAFQCTTIDEKGVRTRCIWGKIHDFTWDEIKKVVVQIFPISMPWGFHSNWVVFRDERNINEHSYVVKKSTYISVKYSKKAKDVIAKYYKGEMKEEIVSER